jgi:hypothetical protein
LCVRTSSSACSRKDGEALQWPGWVFLSRLGGQSDLCEPAERSGRASFPAMQTAAASGRRCFSTDIDDKAVSFVRSGRYAKTTGISRRPNLPRPAARRTHLEPGHGELHDARLILAHERADADGDHEPRVNGRRSKNCTAAGSDNWRCPAKSNSANAKMQATY